MKNNMKHVDVGAPRLIPQGNLSLVPGTFASIRKELDDKNYVSTTRSSAYPNFIPGFYGSGLEGLSGEWQSSTIK